MKTPAIPVPVVREMSDADCRNYGVDRAEYLPTDKLWLAEWPDRSGWYWQDTHIPSAHPCSFFATCFNESEMFPTAEAAQAWLYTRVEVIP